MKGIELLAGVLVAGMLAVAGCKKAPPTMPAPAAEGVTIDLPKLRAAFPAPTAEVRGHLSDAAFGIRYGDYNKTLASLDKLAAGPNLTEEQKKAISEIIEQVKKAAAGGGVKAALLGGGAAC